MFTGKMNTMDLPVTQEMFNRYAEGELIQRAFPDLTPGEREFIKSGVTQEEWDTAFPKDDEE